MRAVAILGGLSAILAGAGCAALAGWDGFSGGAVADSGSDGPRVDASLPDVHVEDAPTDAADAGKIAFVQVNAATSASSTASMVVAPYLQAQGAGDLNVVVVTWYNAVTPTVTDSSGNKYRLASGPTMIDGSNDTYIQSFFYASGIAAAAANANTVTVQFSGPLDSGYDVRIVEYAGLDKTDPLDVAVMNTGTSLMTTSGTITTRGGPELLVHAGTTQREFTVAPPMFTTRINTSENDIVSDRIVPTPGGYTADVATSTAGAWVIQLVAFH